MKYSDSIDVLINKQSLGIMPGLVRILNLLEIMGNPQNKIKIIHIAGTNGKGTVAATIADILMDNGYKTGLFTSPWVVDYREQIQINNHFIPEKKLAFYIEEYKDNDCSEFEFLTAIMYKYFADEKVDYAVIECGLGGLEDATNVEKQNISVITSISFDHTNFLGNTIEEIALQKAGIIKENCTCVLYPNPDCEYVFENECKRKNAKLVKVHISDESSFSEKNVSTAAETLNELGINADVHLSHIPGRQEFINGILFDGGHNVGAARALVDNTFIRNEIALIGMMADKDVDSYLAIVAPQCKFIITTQPDNPRSLSADKLKTIAEKYCSDVVAIENPIEALDFAMEKGLSLVCGSFFLIREIRKEFV